MNVNKTTIYYIIVASIFLINFSYIPLLLEILQQKNTSNIPYITLIGILISQLLLLFIVCYRAYYYHIFIYLVGFICICTILFLKPSYDKNNIQVVNKYVYEEKSNLPNSEEKMNPILINNDINVLNEDLNDEDLNHEDLYQELDD